MHMLCQLSSWIANKVHYYSFKIFSQFWLAKSTRTIHHNQLLMTKFGRILCLTRKWRQKCSFLQVNAPLTEKTWGRDWVVFVVKTKMADTSLVSSRADKGWAVKRAHPSKKVWCSRLGLCLEMLLVFDFGQGLRCGLYIRLCRCHWIMAAWFVFLHFVLVPLC